MKAEAAASARIFAGLLIALLVVGGGPAIWTEHILDAPFLVAPLGASATLLALSPSHAYARPRALILGNLIAAALGMLAARFLGAPLIAAAAALAVSVVVLRALALTHPPSSGLAIATALSGAHALGASLAYLGWHVLAGSAILAIVMRVLAHPPEAGDGGPC